jgi:hypothetical protein
MWCAGINVLLSFSVGICIVVLGVDNSFTVGENQQGPGGIINDKRVMYVQEEMMWITQ